MRKTGYEIIPHKTHETHTEAAEQKIAGPRNHLHGNLAQEKN